jgi:anti-anti-sigma factor
MSDSVNHRVGAHFEIQSRTTHPDGSAVLRLAGHLDVVGAPILSEALHQLLESGVRRVELHMADVEFVSSIGIGTLIAAVGDFEGSGGELTLAGLQQDFLDVLRMLDLLDYVKVR